MNTVEEALCGRQVVFPASLYDINTYIAAGPHNVCRAAHRYDDARAFRRDHYLCGGAGDFVLYNNALHVPWPQQRLCCNYITVLGKA